MKRCSKCGEEKELSEFGKDCNRTEGLYPYCKMCQRARLAKYHAENREEVLARKAKYRAEHPEKERARFAKYYAENREEVLARKAKYRAEHPEKERATKAKWQRDHPGKVRAYNARYYAEHPEECRAKVHKRRARKAGNGGKYTAAEWKALKAKYDNRCLCCGRQEPEIKLTVDHVVPVALGGTSNIDNLQPLCKSCNCRKHTQILDLRPPSCS